MLLRRLTSIAVLSLGFALLSCNPEQASYTPGGRVLTQAAADVDGVTRILLYYDMEGTSGQNDLRSLSYGNEEYDAARQWLTDDVNAVIEGLFAGGADEVDVVDAHGSGNPEPDVLLDQMDARAKMLYKDEPFGPYIDLTESGLYDAVAVVCMHSKSGGGGYAAHTYTIGMDWIFNDMSVNETEIIAYSWGRADVPLIFASGDDKLGEQLSWMTWVEYVTVKTALGADDAELRPFDDVHAEMRVAAERAVENYASANAVQLTTPIRAQLRATSPASLEQLDGVPGIHYEEQTVTFEAADYRDAYDGIEALLRVATGGYTQLLNAAIGEHAGAQAIIGAYRERLMERWTEVESGRWESPVVEQRGSETRRYFGAR